MNKARGFTILEVLMVIAIISALAAVAIFSTGEVREKGRDTKRVSDLEQLHVALRLYAEQNGEYPCELASNCSEQTVNLNNSPYSQTWVGVGGPLDTLLQPYLSLVPQDPFIGKLPTADPDLPYTYYYDGYRECDGEYKAIIYAFMETNQYRTDTTCYALTGLNVYVKVLGLSSDTY